MKQPDTYMIYGANSSIGSELAKKIFPEVQNLILFYHNKTERIGDLISNSKVLSYQSDIKNFNDFKEKINDVFIKKEIMNLAAVFLPAIRSYDHKPLVDTSLEITQEIIEVNLLGVVHFLKGLLQNRLHESQNCNFQTNIVLLGSNVSRIGLKNGSIYSATKAAMANLTRSVAMEVGKANILINTISPGPVETDNSYFLKDYIRFREEYFETQKAFTSLKKIASINEICSLICFLTSLDNTHITGEEIFVTGGAL